MAKSDFDVSENENNDFNYTNVQSNKRNIFNNNSNNMDIVYDENGDNSFLSQLKFKLSTINRNVIFFFIGILAAIIIAIIIISLIVSHYNNSFKTDINIPDVVYLGETASISAISHGSGNLDKTKVSFSAETLKEIDDVIGKDYKANAPLELLNTSMSGKDVYNVIIPVQEGGAKIEVSSKSGVRNMGSVTKTVYVCPRFTSDLVPNGNISVVVNNEINNPINFGYGNCAKGIKYVSSNEEIFTVDNTGKIFGVKAGTANLIVTKGERSFSVPVTVTNSTISMESFNVTPKKILLTPGDNRRLNVSYLPLSTSINDFRFDCSDSEVVFVEGNRLLALKEGTATIKVSSSDVYDNQEVEVVVSKDVSKGSNIVTDLSLDYDNVSLVQGESSKINYFISPIEAGDKTVTFESSDENIASVSSRGVVFAKRAGTATVTAKTNNAIIKTVRVDVSSLKQPNVVADDGIIANNWHNSPYVLKFSGGAVGANYFYGFGKDKINKKGTELSVDKDGVKLFYVKSCVYNLCGSDISVLSKLDSTPPEVLKIIKRSINNSSQSKIFIAANDELSMITSWCVSKSKDSYSCKWNKVEPIKNPVFSTNLDSGEYYVFVKDDAGNISDSEKVLINRTN